LAIALVALTIGITACKEQDTFVQMPSNFEANQATQNGEVTPTATPTATPSATATATPVYDHSTKIELLTPTIINNAPDQFLQVKVTYEGVGGNQENFPFNVMRFDIASVNPDECENSSGVWVNNPQMCLSNPDTAVNKPGASVNLPYTVTVSNALLYQGFLNLVSGSDLFGNTGKHYFHFETDDALDIPTGVTWFLFSVDLSYTENHAYGWNVDDAVPAQEQIQIYVQFGDQSMVAQTPVTFINQ